MPDELISNSIRRKGIYDLVTAEVIYRLLDPGAHALDVGAHVGLMSAVMALRAGSQGQVRSFEPHPAVYAKLCVNAERMNQCLGKEVIHARNLALSDSARQAPLYLPEDWAANTGVARLDHTARNSAPESALVPVMVECQTLDDASVFPSPDLMKIDVEGHELAVLQGAARTLAKLRDVVFEDFGSYPTPVMSLLEQQGFRVFALYRTLHRPVLVEPHRPGVPKDADPNYLATRDPERARRRFAAAGWNVLRSLP